MKSNKILKIKLPLRVNKIHKCTLQHALAVNHVALGKSNATCILVFFEEYVTNAVNVAGTGGICLD